MKPTPDYSDKNNYPDLIENHYVFKISKGQKPERLDVFLTHSIRNASRNKVQMAIDAGNILVNGNIKKASYKVLPDDDIVCKVFQLPPIELVPENIPLNIVYEDEYLLVVDKPAGMCVHPGVGNRYGTLVNALLYHFGFRENVEINLEDDDADKDDEDITEIYNYQVFEYPLPRGEGSRNQQTDAMRPGLVHRIDKDTSGLLVVAKNQYIHHQLALQFANKTTEREYYAIVWGRPKVDAGTITGNIGRSPRDRTSFAVLERGGKIAITDYAVIERFTYTALLKFKLRTGRTHQIRVHSGSIGHKIFGDIRYGGDKILYGNENPKWKTFATKQVQAVGRQMLHAKTLGFVHPMTKEFMLFNSELPDDMQQLLNAMRDSKY
jgi:23S rRNA pseudouridine1911/1915/1917 synthase